jgi:hypothetical protein
MYHTHSRYTGLDYFPYSGAGKRKDRSRWNGQVIVVNWKRLLSRKPAGVRRCQGFYLQLELTSTPPVLSSTIYEFPISW